MIYSSIGKAYVLVLPFILLPVSAYQLQPLRIPCSISTHSCSHGRGNDERFSSNASKYTVQRRIVSPPASRQHVSSLFSSVRDSEGALTESESEVERILFGWNLLVTGEAWGESSSVRQLWTSVEDIVGVWGHVPLIIASFQTALTGKCNELEYGICIATILLTSLAHGKMTYDTPRDWRAPRLAEYQSVYEFSALYLIPFGWLTARIQTYFPKELEVLDPIMSLLFSAVTIYGVAYALYGKRLLDDANRARDTASENESLTDVDGSQQILPSSPAYQKQAQLYLTGNIVINSLACLFIPFAWTLTVRGTEWWERVQTLHPNQQAFLGLSVLVAAIGDISGNLLLRLKQLRVVTASESIVVMGIMSNILLLLIPELVFNGIYSSGISEIGFYFE